MSTAAAAQSRFRQPGLWREALTVGITIGPGILWIVLFLILPALYLISVAFMTNGPYGSPQMPWTLDAFRQLAGYGILGWSPGNLETIGRSLVQTVAATVMVTVVGYPIAFYITTCRARWRPIMLLLILVPSWTNKVIRAYGWMSLLAPGTVPSRIAVWLGLLPQHMGLFPSNFAVALGLVYNFLPFMVLPLYAAFEKLDYAQVEAARDLYANRARTFWHAVFPQTLPGMLAGIILVSIPAFGIFIIPQLLGGGKAFMLGNLVEQQFTSSSNWPLGAAASSLMLIATFIGLAIFRRLGRRLGRGEATVI